MGLTLDQALEKWQVYDPGMWENDLSETESLKNWSAVSDDKGIKAYFADSDDAYRYRLFMVNMDCNPISEGKKINIDKTIENLKQYGVLIKFEKGSWLWTDIDSKGNILGSFSRAFNTFYECLDDIRDESANETYIADSIEYE